MVTGASTDIDDDHVCLQLCEVANQSLFLGIRQICRSQRISGPWQQLQKGVRRNWLEHFVQPLHTAIDKVGQRAGRIQHPEQDMRVGTSHVEIGENDSLASFRQ